MPGLSLGLGLGLSPSGQSGIVFTDELTGTIAAPTIAANQGYQRSGVGVVLSGTYSLDGDPTGIVYRVDGSPWTQLASETIGSSAWQGTAFFPYYGQGTLEFKPINGDSVSAATVANITVGEVFAINGQSNAEGRGDNDQSYTPINYTLLVFDDGTWTQRSSDPWTGTAGNRGPYMRLAELFDIDGIPLILVRGHTAGSTALNGGSGAWGEGNSAYTAAVTDMNLAATGGWAGWLWDQGEQDVVLANGAYNTDFIAMHTAMQAAVDNGANVGVSMLILGEVGTETTQLDEVRNDMITAIEGEADIFYGPNMISMDYPSPDNVHAETDAQLTLKGEYWYRAIRADYFGASDPAVGPQIVSYDQIAANKTRLTFDRAMQNHTDVTGWHAEDDGGALTISSAAAATVTIANDSVDLTYSANTGGEVHIWFGRFNEAVGSTLTDTGTHANFPPKFTSDLNTSGFLAAPVNLTVPTLPGAAPNVGTQFLAVAGTYSGFPAPTLTYQWYLDDVLIIGATSIGYTPVIGDLTGILHVVETATNSEGSDTAQSADSLAVTNVAFSEMGVIFEGTDTYLSRGSHTFTSDDMLFFFAIDFNVYSIQEYLFSMDVIDTGCNRLANNGLRPFVRDGADAAGAYSIFPAHTALTVPRRLNFLIGLNGDTLCKAIIWDAETGAWNSQTNDTSIGGDGTVKLAYSAISLAARSDGAHISNYTVFRMAMWNTYADINTSGVQDNFCNSSTGVLVDPATSQAAYGTPIWDFYGDADAWNDLSADHGSLGSWTMNGTGVTNA